MIVQMVIMLVGGDAASGVMLLLGSDGDIEMNDHGGIGKFFFFFLKWTETIRLN